jgi:hypothetical protein
MHRDCRLLPVEFPVQVLSRRRHAAVDGSAWLGERDEFSFKVFDPCCTASTTVWWSYRRSFPGVRKAGFILPAVSHRRSVFVLTPSIPATAPKAKQLAMRAMFMPRNSING